MILLDVMLPKLDGFSVLELLRKESQVPVIMVTARDSVEDQLRGFELLVDDYITKPFDMPVLFVQNCCSAAACGKIHGRRDASL